jgi:hypothetical protein
METLKEKLTTAPALMPLQYGEGAGEEENTSFNTFGFRVAHHHRQESYYKESESAQEGFICS